MTKKPSHPALSGFAHNRRHLRLLLAALMLAAAAALWPTASAENFARGQDLYENHCQGCHQDLLHRRENRKVKSLEDLRTRVTSWAIHSGGNWGPAEVEDVLYYLDQSFYHFEGKHR